MRVISLLLVAQALGLIGVCAIYLSRVRWGWEAAAILRTPDALDSVLLVALLGPVALFELATALSMWWLRPAAGCGP
jgi:hypothetical protein